MNHSTFQIANASFRKSASTAVMLIAALALAGCATTSPQISYDATVPPLPAIHASAVDATPKAILVPPTWTPAKGGDPATTPAGRVENANKAARVEPRKEGYFNAIQIYPWSDGALYQVYAAPGQITDIALEPGETLTGDGPIAAGDTTRWIIGNTQSGSGPTHQVHVLVKPTRPEITTNLVITTDRRTYMMELRADTSPYMPAVAWSYPQVDTQRLTLPATPALPGAAARHYRYGLGGGNPPWRPLAVYDDGRHVYVEFPRGIVQGEMPPIFVIGSDGQAQIVNTRILNNVLIVDQLFAAAELRLGSGSHQQTVRIVRTDGRHGS
ncbi:MAG: P-type conjugative transfer protein TrbG [Devosia sp. 67-54]|uniref:P-type conjugative transfer protein TrbG n=1 Tax=unclassified Devosia TaxID=196773 RepID=UPI00096504AE|nr:MULTISPECIES: P-type conjugative transfer protein TrbG [unclassified Devosia]MBN9306968.1 P-type conjugative transfer protein TrbG [Devosia sp.]OJX16943.1 MAG: P-type conjugative transfer protein TrbG [Devosia sp. 67-54]